MLLVEFNKVVGRPVREVRREDIMIDNYRAKNYADLIHPVMERYASATEVNSIDGDIPRYNGRHGLHARNPLVKVVRLTE